MSMNLNKVSGIYMLVNTFLPIIFILGILLFTTISWSKIRSNLEFYEQSLQVVITEAQKAKVQIEIATQTLIDKSGKITKKGKQVIKRVNSVSTNVGKAIDGFSAAFASPFKNFPNVLGGAYIRKGMRNLGNSVAAPFRPLTNEFKAVGKDIGAIQEEIADITSELGKFGSMHKYLSSIETEYNKQLVKLKAFKESLIFIFYMAMIFILVFLLWTSLGYALWMRTRIIQSMALINESQKAST